MAHFAQLDDSATVVQVIVVNNAELMDIGGAESELIGIEFCRSLFGANTQWVQTSYNGKIRKNFAGVGYTYDAQRDAFIAPQPFASWSLNEGTCTWLPPVPHPNDGKLYRWDEDSKAWIEISA